MGWSRDLPISTCPPEERYSSSIGCRSTVEQTDRQIAGFGKAFKRSLAGNMTRYYYCKTHCRTNKRILLSEATRKAPGHTEGKSRGGLLHVLD